ncbi:MAG: AAC(3) family N-acetyltransferase [Actinomycetota bacterium]|nr:AAC(3) family N-acetyltransferase [Actinomycetota bacterium]
MSEHEVVAATARPATVSSLVRDLHALGVAEGMTLFVHSSLSSLGWVAGGPQAVVIALQQAVGDAGTLAMPAHSTSLSEPSQWQHPPVPESWWETIRNETPAFDPRLTPTRGMGRIPETFRSAPGVLRSDHPQASVVARGPSAPFLTEGHELDSGVGEGSPMARLYDLDGWVLLLGVTHGRNTSLHLSEYRATFPGKKNERQGAPVMVDGERRWVEFEDLDWDEDDFPEIGAAFEAATDEVTVGKVAQAESRLMRQRPLVDFGVQWMERNRGL